MTPDIIIDFWFSDRARPLHFRKSQEFDREITRQFLSTYEKASRRELDGWREVAIDCLALIIVLDQFPRNMFRDDPRSFDKDDLACRTSHLALSQGFDEGLTSEQRSFLYMPFMHSEDLADQELSVALFEKPGMGSSLEFALAHRDIIARFGRFPHRNEILGRQSTPQEIVFLTEPGSGF